MKKIISVFLATALLAGLTACTYNIDKDIDIKVKTSMNTDETKETDETDITQKDGPSDDLKSGDTLMFSARNGNWGEVCTTDDYWQSTNYEVYYDGTIKCIKSYNLSGLSVGTTTLSDKDYKKIYDFAYDAYTNDSFSDYSEDGCDGENWSFVYYDSDENAHDLYSGYAYGNDDMTTIEDILESYQDDMEFTDDQMPDSGEMLRISWYSMEPCDQDSMIGEEYIIYYDNTVELYSLYNSKNNELSKTITISDDTLKYLWDFSKDSIKEQTFAGYSENVDDGDIWMFEFQSGSGQYITIYYGYIYDNEQLSEVADTLKACFE